jgi:ubiquitin-conjugating enzyme E2 L3
MAASRRLMKEYSDLQKSPNETIQNGVKNLKTDAQSILKWTGQIYPSKAPYDKGSFKIEILFPAEYPFKPPKVTLKTKIYHPNIDEKGQICLPIIHAENWKPATKVEHVIVSLIELIDSPECEHPLRADIAREYTSDLKTFMKKGEDFTKKHAEPR